jgi:hypothetical protein
MGWALEVLADRAVAKIDKKPAISSFSATGPETVYSPVHRPELGWCNNFGAPVCFSFPSRRSPTGVTAPGLEFRNLAYEARRASSERTASHP